MFRYYTTSSLIFTKASVALRNAAPQFDLFGFETNEKCLWVNGHFGSPTVTSIERTTYATDTTAVIVGQTVSQYSNYCFGTGNSVRGYTGGGYNAGATNTFVWKHTYATEIVAASTALSTAVGRGGGSGNLTAGYVTVGNGTTTVLKLTYATDGTATLASAALPSGKTDFSVISSPDKAYFGPSSTAGQRRTIGGMPFSTETTAAVVGGDTTADGGHTAGLNTSAAGYFFAGGFGQKFSFTTETCAAITAASPSTGAPGGSQGTNNGYIAGGYVSSIIARGYKFPFSTETIAANTSVNLTSARYSPGCCG